jgi:hypothetical protein
VLGFLRIRGGLSAEWPLLRQKIERADKSSEDIDGGETGVNCMRFLGFLLLLAGWAITLAAVALLAGKASLGVFVVAGVLVEVMGLVFVSRSHSISQVPTE